MQCALQTARELERRVEVTMQRKGKNYSRKFPTFFYFRSNKIWNLNRISLSFLQYSSIDTSPLSVNVMHPFWNYLVQVMKLFFFQVVPFLLQDNFRLMLDILVAQQFFPKWIAPNLITFVGFLFTALNFIMLSWFDWGFHSSTGYEDTAPIPNWFWLLAAINIFLAYTLDGIDGKQARRIGLSGPLGELFDHGLDSYTGIYYAHNLLRSSKKHITIILIGFPQQLH